MSWSMYRRRGRTDRHGNNASHRLERTDGHPDEEVVASRALSQAPHQPDAILCGMLLGAALRILATEFACEVRRGKGSEIVAYREGGKCWRCGCHGRNKELSPIDLKRALRRLAIDRTEWLAAVRT